jgi:NADH-quinone oxidoreductase subunit L
MEGPTPVSCLIHAATMVAAGVYLVARSYPLFVARAVGANGIPELATLHWPLVGAVTAPAVVATIGGITVLLGAVTAIAQNDIKRILAYSTISQLGYMVMALGVGGIIGREEGAEKIALVASQAGLVAGMFHLMTHAYFKGLLFLGSGSVIHGAGTQNIWEMGGLKKAMPRTFWTFSAGTAALMGMPLTSGFWSKDEILSIAYRNAPMFFWVGAAGALLTAFYMTRCWTITFLGERRAVHSEEGTTHPHAHESPPSMTVPLMILAVPALLVGFVGTPFGNGIHHWLAPGDESEAFNFLPMAIGIAMFFLGTGIGWAIYGKQPERDPLEVHAPSLHYFLDARMHLDQAMYLLLVKPMFAADQVFAWIDANVIDGIVNGVGWLAIQISKLWRWVDSTIVDGTVNLVGFVTGASGNALRLAQTGRVQTYLAVIIFGLLVLLVVGAR